MANFLEHPDAEKDAGLQAVPKKPISMHEDIPVWADCCCCEAEPYWLALAEEENPGLYGSEKEQEE
ncbi:MAG: hypothetical protein AB7U30_09790 [Sulfuricellaceae bacterium]